MKTLKKFFCVLLCVVVMTTFIFAPQVNAAAVTVTTVLGAAAILAAMTAAGYYLVTNDGSIQQAGEALANDFISFAGSEWNGLQIIARTTGQTFAQFPSALWNTFTMWLRQTFGVSGQSSIAIGGVLGMPYVTNVDWNNPSQFISYDSISSIPWGSCYISEVSFPGEYMSYRLVFDNAVCKRGYPYNPHWIEMASPLVNTLWTGGMPTFILGAYLDENNAWCHSYEATHIGGGGVYYPGNRYAVNGHPLDLYWDSNTGFIRRDSTSGAIVSNYIWDSFAQYLTKSISIGSLIGNWSAFGYGEDVLVPSDPGLGVDFGTGKVGSDTVGSLPYEIPDGNIVRVPVSGDWVNPGGNTIGSNSRNGTVTFPDGTIVLPDGRTILPEGTTINPGRDIVTPGDITIPVPGSITYNPDGTITVDSVPDVINPADDTFIPDLTDYVDPSLDIPYGDSIDSPLDDVLPSTDILPTDTTIDGTQDIPIPDSTTVTTDTTIEDEDVTDVPDTDSYPDNPTPEDNTSNTNRMKLSSIIITKFPFCIPWDFYNSIKGLVANPSPPVFNYTFNFGSILGSAFSYDLSFNFEKFETLAKIVRWFFSLSWIIALIFITKKLIWK